MNKEPDDQSFRKEYRRKKIKDKSNRKFYDSDDPLDRKAHKQSEVKKIKEEIDNEEWEDWDRYYNH